MIDAARDASGVDIPVQDTDRRAGDPVAIYGDNRQRGRPARVAARPQPHDDRVERLAVALHPPGRLPGLRVADRFGGSVGRPLLFVDIDGVLNPYGGPCPEHFDEHWLFPDDDEPVRVCLSHGVWLHELAARYDLAWGSAWTAPDRALLAGVLDLPDFVGAVELPSGRFDPALKVPAVDRVAGTRPTGWIDDLLGAEAHRWAAERPAPTLLVPVDPATGLDRDHVDQLLGWADQLDG